MPAIRDRSQALHATNTLRSLEVPMPAYVAGDLLIAMMSADTGSQTWKGGNPVASCQRDVAGAFTDYTTAANNSTAADVNPLAAGTPAVNDAFYIGSSVPFTDAFMWFSTQGVGTWTITWEYRKNDSTWAALAGVTDNTTSLKAATTFPVNVTYTMPTDWATVAVNGNTAYYIRGRISAFTSVTTRPIVTQVWCCDDGPNGWKQFLSSTNTSNLGWLYKTAGASEVDTTFFYTVAETVNGSIISIRDVDGIKDTGSNAQTISVVAASKTFTRSTGSFLTDGFAAGMNVTTSGFTNGGNNGRKVIASVTDTVMTMTVSTSLVDETGNANERVVSSPFDGPVGNATSTTSAAKANMPTITTVANNCLLLYGCAHSAVAVPCIIEGPCQMVFGKDGSAHSDACSWGFQGTAGGTPSTVGMSNLSAAAAQLAIIAIAPPVVGASVIPAYTAADDSVYVSPFTGAAFNGDSADATTITTPFTGTIDGKTLNAGVVANVADSGINSYHAQTGYTGITTPNQYAGIRTTIVARTTIGGKNILFHQQPTTPIAIQTTDGVTLSGARGVAIGLASTAGNFKVWHVGGAFTSWGTQRHSPAVIHTDATDGLLQSTGSFNAASITEIGNMVSAKNTAPSWLCGSIWALDTCKIAGGSVAEPINIEGLVTAYADGHERRSAIRQGKSQVLLLGPVQIGDGGTSPFNLGLDGTAIEFPRKYNKDLREVFYNSIDNFAGLIYYPGASDVVRHKNSVVSSPSRYKWGLHASASAAATYDFSGLQVIGAGTITLGKAITVTGLTINDYSTLDAAGLNFDAGTIKNVPAANDSLTIDTSTLIEHSVIDVSLVTAGNRWVSTAFPDGFENNAFTGGGGHAIRITATGSFTLIGNTFTGFGADGSTGAAIYNDSGGAVTLTITGGGSTPTIRNGAGASTTLIISPVDTTITVKDINTGSAIQNARVLVTASDNTGPMPFEETVTISRSGSTATVSHTAHGLVNGKKVKIKGADQQEYNGIFVIAYIDANSYSYTVSGTPATPATGTIKATGVVIDGLTDSSGIITDNRSHASNQPIAGRVRKATGGTLYKTGSISGTINSATGFSTIVQMIPDA